MRLLVTGGLGFIGSNFIRHVLTKYGDISITNLDDITTGPNPESLKDLSDNRNYSLVKGNITDDKLVTKIIQGVDTIVNFAAETHVDRSIADPRPFMDSNVEGVFTLLEATRKVNRSARFIQVSTDEVYGDIADGSFTEDSRLRPSSPYSATKAAADMLATSYHRTYGLKIIITRSTNNFGPFQFPEKLIPKTIIRALKNLPIPVYGTGTNVRDWLYVLDHCEAINQIIRNGRDGEIYNISTGKEISNIDIVRTILRLINKPKELITFVEDRPGHDVRYSLDSSKLRRELQWSPKHDFADALRETTDWYVHNSWWWEPLVTEEVLHPRPWKLR